MIKKKVGAILLSLVVISSTLAFSKVTVNAAIQNGWKQSQSTWYYYINGNAAKGWQYINNTWYYLESNGAMATGWKCINNTWYYLESNGAMATGWKCINNTWYYLNSNGAMATGWITDGNKSYYLNNNGSMAVNTTTPDGYVVGADGAWDGQAKKQSNRLLSKEEIKDVFRKYSGWIPSTENDGWSFGKIEYWKIGDEYYYCLNIIIENRFGLHRTDVFFIDAKSPNKVMDYVQFDKHGEEHEVYSENPMP